ncbi:MAG: hypothetical protein NC204_00025 [Candidatus Amulumruptor caecigallinarius]|nr:hypothetical protein [Candidatus Amulumruptor caecigallinarius]
MGSFSKSEKTGLIILAVVTLVIVLAGVLIHTGASTSTPPVPRVIYVDNTSCDSASGKHPGRKKGRKTRKRKNTSTRGSKKAPATQNQEKRNPLKAVPIKSRSDSTGSI